MTEKQILDKLAVIFKDALEINYFNPEISMENTPEWDSLRHIQLLVAVEKGFDVEITFEDTLDMTTVSGVVHILKKYLNEAY